jgi:carbon monoxide dehydrogenase subunit G
MRYEGTLESDASPKAFIDFVTSPERMVKILPDIEESRITDDRHFWVKAKVGIGYLKGSLSINFELQEQKEDQVRIVGRGQGMQSSVNLDLALKVEGSGTGTKAGWTADVTVGGLLASVGGRLIDGAAQKYMREITEALHQKVS